MTLRRAVALLVLVTVLSACGSTKGKQMDPEFTATAAQTQLLELFSQTLALLPAETSLSLERSSPKLQSHDLGVSAPCDDNDQTGKGPVNLSIAYWVHGVPQGVERKYVDMVAAGWAEKGWSPRDDGGAQSRIVRGYPLRGYAVIIQVNPVGGVSLTGSSPCFPFANVNVTTPQPRTVPHPAG